MSTGSRVRTRRLFSRRDGISGGEEFRVMLRAEWGAREVRRGTEPYRQELSGSGSGRKTVSPKSNSSPGRPGDQFATEGSPREIHRFRQVQERAPEALTSRARQHDFWRPLSMPTRFGSPS